MFMNNRTTKGGNNIFDYPLTACTVVHCCFPCGWHSAQLTAWNHPTNAQVKLGKEHCCVWVWVFRERFDTRDPHGGFAGDVENTHRATARALRHARKPQRVRGRSSRYGGRHSERVPTRVKPAEGSRTKLKIRTASQRGLCDAGETYRGLAGQI